MSEQSRVFYEYPPEIDPAAVTLTVQESREGVCAAVAFARLTGADFPPVLAHVLPGGPCFGETKSDTRQVFLQYDCHGKPRALFAYRAMVWGWQPLGTYRGPRPSDLLLQFATSLQMEAFRLAVLRTMQEGSPDHTPLYATDLRAAPQVVRD